MSLYINDGSSSTSFADELYHKFLLCPLCSQIFRQPKVLNCQHSFCTECIEAHYEMDEGDRPYRFLLSYNRDLSCPVCRTRTPLPNGGVRRLPDNFLVANLTDVINKRKPMTSLTPEQVGCDICSRHADAPNGGVTSENRKQGVVKCLDCVKVLCSECAERHGKTKVTATHSLFSLELEQDVECKMHKNETLRFYCEPCETCVCVLCTFQDHKDHDVTSLLDGLQRHRGSFETLVDNCRCRIDILRNQIQLIDKCETGLRQAEDHIRGAAIDSIAAVRRREKQLLVELRQAVGENTFEFMADRKSLEEQLSESENTYSLTETMMRGTSVELLMLKKELLGKLNAVLEVAVRPTPEGLQRTVKLLPEDSFEGSSDSTLFSFGDEKSGNQKNVEVVDGEVQTDEKETKFANTSTTDDGVIIGRSTCTQTSQEDLNQLPVVHPLITLPTDNHIQLTPVAEPRKKLNINFMTSQSMSTVEQTGNHREMRRSSIQGRWPLEKSHSISSQGSIELPSPPATPSTPRNIPNFSRPKPPPPTFVERSMETTPVVKVDSSTYMIRSMTSNKETSTGHITQVHKNVATENQEMADKSTSTMTVDVTAAYRNLTTSKKTTTVSRGTSTTISPKTDRASSPVKSLGMPISVITSAVPKIPPSPTIARPVLVTSSAAGQVSIRVGDSAKAVDRFQSTNQAISNAVASLASKDVTRQATPAAAVVGLPSK